MCMHNDVGHRPEVPIEGTHPPPAEVPEGNAHSDDSEVVVGGGPTSDTIRRALGALRLAPPHAQR
jgi:hypothetical protein